MNEQEILEDCFDDGEEQLPTHCPNCAYEYDAIDYKYQICHLCGFDNSKHETPMPTKFKS